MPPRLSVNIDHVATLLRARYRGTDSESPLREPDQCGFMRVGHVRGRASIVITHLHVESRGAFRDHTALGGDAVRNRYLRDISSRRNVCIPRPSHGPHAPHGLIALAITSHRQAARDLNRSMFIHDNMTAARQAALIRPCLVSNRAAAHYEKRPRERGLFNSPE